jgi:hypothetical protein
MINQQSRRTTSAASAAALLVATVIGLGLDNAACTGPQGPPGPPGPPGSSGGTTSGPAAVSVSAGSVDACAVLADGSVWCWGNDGDDQVGSGVDGGGGVNKWSIPVRVALGGPAQSVAAGDGFSCALLTDATVWCWGGLPGPPAKPTTVPTMVAFPPGTVAGDGGDAGAPYARHATAIAVSHGGVVPDTARYACALMNDRTVWCWGFLGGAGILTQPTQMQGLTSATSIAVGHSYACATQVDDSLWCWGNINIGIPETSQTPVNFGSQAGQLALNATPASPLAAGDRTACGLLSDGRVVCWGSNSSLLEGSKAVFQPPQFVHQVDNAIVVAVGFSSACAIISGGRVTCWGQGPLGDGSGSHSLSLTRVWVSDLADVTSVAVGDNLACAVSNGGVWCWGEGAFGDGTNKGSAVPVPVVGVGTTPDAGLPDAAAGDDASGDDVSGDDAFGADASDATAPTDASDSASDSPADSPADSPFDAPPDAPLPDAGGCAAPPIASGPAIFVIDSTGTMYSFDAQGTKTGSVALPTPIADINGGGIGFASPDSLFVSIGSPSNALAKYDLQLNKVMLKPGAFPGLNTPRGVAYDCNDGDVYVGNGGGNVPVADTNGTSVSLKGNFPNNYGPSGVAYDRDDDIIWIANYGGFNWNGKTPTFGVNAYRPDGTAGPTFNYATQFVPPNSPHLEPYSVTVCPFAALDGGGSTRVVVGFIDDGSHLATGAVQAYNTGGASIGAPFAGNLTKPYAVSCDSHGYVYIADANGLFRDDASGNAVPLQGDIATLPKAPIYGVFAGE